LNPHAQVQADTAHGSGILVSFPDLNPHGRVWQLSATFSGPI